MIPSISDAELIVMQILWENESLTAKQIVELIKEQSWNEKTIRTFIYRLVEKKAVSKEMTSEGYKFKALVTKKDYYRDSNQSFLKKMYQGSIKKMVMNFIEDENISDEEMKEIRDLINSKYD